MLYLLSTDRFVLYPVDWASATSSVPPSVLTSLNVSPFFFTVGYLTPKHLMLPHFLSWHCFNLVDMGTKPGTRQGGLEKRLASTCQRNLVVADFIRTSAIPNAKWLYPMPHPPHCGGTCRRWPPAYPTTASGSASVAGGGREFASHREQRPPSDGHGSWTEERIAENTAEWSGPQWERLFSAPWEIRCARGGRPTTILSTALRGTRAQPGAQPAASNPPHHHPLAARLFRYPLFAMVLRLTGEYKGIAGLYTESLHISQSPVCGQASHSEWYPLYRELQRHLP
jgi:hypothetical protein